MTIHPLAVYVVAVYALIGSIIAAGEGAPAFVTVPVIIGAAVALILTARRVTRREAQSTEVEDNEPFDEWRWE